MSSPDTATPETAAPVLLADIGGTNARFSLFRSGSLSGTRILACADFPSPAAAADAYLADLPPGERPTRGAFAIAGPVVGDAITMVNRGWTFSIEGTRRALGFDRLAVVNDFTAVALSIPRLTEGDLLRVGGGAAVPGMPVAVLGPGSGLGVSGLLPRPDGGLGGGWMALAGEGGHATMAAADAREAMVLEVLRGEYGHVSAERVLSGPGLAALYRGIAKVDGVGTAAPKADAITAAALNGSDPVAVAAVDMFCAMLGTVAGDLALTLGALGGVYVAGGIVPRLGDAFARSRFRERFVAKGRLSSYLEAIPTAVIIHPLPAFLGLAEAAEAV